VVLAAFHRRRSSTGKNTSFVVRRTGFETSWRLGSDDATARGYFSHQAPIIGTASRMRCGSDASRGDPVQRVHVRPFNAALAQQVRGARFRTASVRVRLPRAVRQRTRGPRVQVPDLARRTTIRCRSNGRTPDCYSGDRGSSPCVGASHTSVAQRIGRRSTKPGTQVRLRPVTPATLMQAPTRSHKPGARGSTPRSATDQ
jgi:hypothetical protein